MNELVRKVLAGRTVNEMLHDEARAIKAIGEDKREMTYNAKIEHGYVTGKILPVPKEAN